MKTDIKKDQIDITDLARSFQRYLYAIKDNDKETQKVVLLDITNWLTLLPSGSGLDNGVKFDWNKSKPNRLVFNCDYHHMNSDGHFTGWTQHKLIITPSFVHGHEMKITGRDKNNVKEYLYEVFYDVFYY